MVTGAVVDNYNVMTRQLEEINSYLQPYSTARRCPYQSLAVLDTGFRAVLKSSCQLFPAAVTCGRPYKVPFAHLAAANALVVSKYPS